MGGGGGEGGATVLLTWPMVLQPGLPARGPLENQPTTLVVYFSTLIT